MASLPLLPAIGQFTGLAGGPCGKEVRVTFTGNHLTMRLVSDRDLAYYKAQTVGGYQAQPMEVTVARVAGGKEVTFLAGFSEGPKTEPPALQIEETSSTRLVFRVGRGSRSYRIAVDLAGGPAEVLRHP